MGCLLAADGLRWSEMVGAGQGGGEAQFLHLHAGPCYYLTF